MAAEATAPSRPGRSPAAPPRPRPPPAPRCPRRPHCPPRRQLPQHKAGQQAHPCRAGAEAGHPTLEASPPRPAAAAAGGTGEERAAQSAGTKRMYATRARAHLSGKFFCVTVWRSGGGSLAGAQLLRDSRCARGRRCGWALLFHVDLMTLFGEMFSLASAWGGGGAADAVVVGTPLPPSPLPADCGGDGQSRAGSSDATDSVPPPDAGLKGPLATDQEFVATLLSAFALVPVVAANALVPLTQVAASSYAEVRLATGSGAAVGEAASQSARRRWRLTRGYCSRPSHLGKTPPGPIPPPRLPSPLLEPPSLRKSAHAVLVPFLYGFRRRAAAVVASRRLLRRGGGHGHRRVGPVRLPLVLAEVLPPARRGSPTLG